MNIIFAVTFLLILSRINLLPAKQQRLVVGTQSKMCTLRCRFSKEYIYTITHLSLPAFNRFIPAGYYAKTVIMFLNDLLMGYCEGAPVVVMIKVADF